MKREFVYLPSFEASWKKCRLNEEDYKDLEDILCDNPQKGTLEKGTGGLRKLRFSLDNKGKSGGARVLYVDYTSYEKIYLINAYPKSQKVSLTDDEKNHVKKLINKLGNELRRK